MDDVRGDFLGPPHGTTPAAVKNFSFLQFKKSLYIAWTSSCNGYFH